jgi:competence protein ComEC
MKFPLLWIAVAFVAGVALPGALPLLPLVWLSLSVAAILMGLLLLRRKRHGAAWACGLAAWALLGSLAAQLERAAVPANHVARLVAEGRLDTSEPLRWRGYLRSDPVHLPWGFRYEIDLDEVDVASRSLPVTGGLRVSYYARPTDRESAPPLRAGDRVEALVRARAPRNFLDPGAFDARTFLARQKIDLTATLRSAELLQKIGPPSPRLSYQLARLRGRLLARLDELFAPRRAAVLRAMLLGDRSFVDSDLVVVFQKSAAYHVLVVAGLHVAALAAFLFWLGRRLRLSLPPATLMTMLVLASYVAVVEDRPPILRATLMAAVVLCARLAFRRVAVLNSVALAALLLLLWRPSELADPSFQLSFLAAGVIGGLALPWIDRSSSPYRHGVEHISDVTRDGVHPPRVIQFRLDLRAAAGWLGARLPQRLAPRAPQWLAAASSGALRLWDIAVLSLVIQLGLLPLLALYFHRVSLSGPLANIPAVLLAGLIVPLGFLTLLASLIWVPLGAALGKLLGPFVSVLVATVEWFGSWQWASYRIPGPPAWVLAAFFATLALLATAALAARDSHRSARRRERYLAVPLAALVLVVITYPFPPKLAKGRLELTVLDVGQGDSLFAAFPDGRTMLIDGGGAAGAFRVGGYRAGVDVGEEAVSPFLWSRGLKSLDVVALTHAHHDHLDGLNAVLENFRVGQLWVGRDVDSPAYRALLARAGARGAAIVPRQRGATFDWDGVAGRVLWPPDSSSVAAASNNDSLVLRVSDGGVAFLLPGDIEQPVEEQLLADGDPLEANFLKAPHHGSRTSSSPEFLARVAPQVAVISVGEGNPFGHPYPLVVERYRGAGVRLYRTDRDGAVTALTDGRALEISRYLQPPPH